MLFFHTCSVTGTLPLTTSPHTLFSMSLCSAVHQMLMPRPLAYSVPHPLSPPLPANPTSGVPSHMSGSLFFSLCQRGF